MKIGFLGTGHITSSVIEGIIKSKLKVKKIYISPRNRLISKKLSKLVRDNMKKVTASIQGDSLRITGKNKDDLQAAINLIKKQEEEFDIALQFQNYR